jgi:signal transduction histidine kinase
VRLFDEIQDKSRQLEEASQHKSQFLANMSHELRTPLNAILGYTELMADGAYGEPSEKMLGILKRLEANGKHLLGLINDVLDLSKIEAGQLVLELSDYCVQDIAQTVRSTLEPSCRQEARIQSRSCSATALRPRRWTALDASPHQSRRQRHQVH